MFAFRFQDAGIRLGGLVSDINGTSAQAMIAGLIAGRPLTELIDCARGRMQAKREPLRQALDEPLSERHRGCCRSYIITSTFWNTS
jgi:hypothetical protein